MIKSLGIKPRNEKAAADYLVDFFILSGALFNYKISTFQKLTMEEIIDKLNLTESDRAARKDTFNKTSGQLLIESEEKDQLVRHNNLKQLYILRFFLVTAPPVLTMDVKLGNLCNPKGDLSDFVYNDLTDYLGKLDLIWQFPIGTRYNDEIYFYMSRGILNPNILETIPNH